MANATADPCMWIRRSDTLGVVLFGTCRRSLAEKESAMRVALVNMPFADWDRPSVALSQLAAHTKREFGDSVSVDIRYVNIDFALLFGAGEYKQFANNAAFLTTGIGEWLFRGV